MALNPNPSKLDQTQIMQRSFDGDNDRLRVDATVSASIGEVSIQDASTGDDMRVNPDGSIDVNLNGVTTTTVGPSTGLDVNILNSLSLAIDALTSPTPDNILGVGSEDGTASGTKHVLKIGSDLNLRVKDEDVLAQLATLNATTSSQSATLTAIANNTDGIEGLLGTVNTSILAGNTSLSNILSSVDGLETLIGTTNSLLGTVNSSISAGNSTLSNILTSVDGLETLVGNSNTLLTSIDGILTTSNSFLSNIANNTDGLEALQTAGNSSLSSMDTKLSTIISTLAAQEPMIIAGTEDGTPSGVERAFVNNRKQQILASADRISSYTYADFGTKNQRVTQVDYTSVTFPGITARRIFSYVLDSGQYRRTNETWSIV